MKPYPTPSKRSTLQAALRTLHTALRTPLPHREGSGMGLPFLLFSFFTLTLLSACTDSSDKTDSDANRAAWQRYGEARKAKDIERTVALIDSMSQADIIDDAKADYLRAIAYDNGWQMRIAEHYYRKAYESYSTDPSQDWFTYGDAGYRWACLRFGRGDTEGALGVVSTLLVEAERNEAFPKDVEASLLMLMADAQLQLHQDDEARHNWQRAYEAQQEANGEKADLPWLTLSISASLFNMGDIPGAQEWLQRSEEEFARFEQTCSDSMLIEEWKGHIALRRARYLQAAGHTQQAGEIYAAVPRSRIFEPHGYTEAAEYTMDAGRYDEAAYWYEQLDSTYLATDGAQMTFDNIASRLTPRYIAYRKAGRNQDAQSVADSIVAAIDSALIWQKQNDAAELAVVYQTHEKDLQLKNLQFTISVHRIFAVALAVILLLIGYLWWRAYKYNKVLASKNRHLYEQIQQRELEELQAIAQLKAEPEESLTPQQQLFRRLCMLMADQQPYTDESLNRDGLAQLLGTNSKYIDQAIHDCSHGETTGAFINRYRMEQAARLLKTTDDPVSLIGELVGIPSRATLARLFRNTYGMTCSEFRNTARANSR